MCHAGPIALSTQLEYLQILNPSIVAVTGSKRRAMVQWMARDWQVERRISRASRFLGRNRIRASSSSNRAPHRPPIKGSPAGYDCDSRARWEGARGCTAVCLGQVPEPRVIPRSRRGFRLSLRESLSTWIALSEVARTTPPMGGSRFLAEGRVQKTGEREFRRRNVGRCTDIGDAVLSRLSRLLNLSASRAQCGHRARFLCPVPAPGFEPGTS